jgi:hypothetical protein
VARFLEQERPPGDFSLIHDWARHLQEDK